MKRYVVIFCVLLGGCRVVDNPAGLESEGFFDPALVGEWVGQEPITGTLVDVRLTILPSDVNSGIAIAETDDPGDPPQVQWFGLNEVNGAVMVSIPLWDEETHMGYMIFRVHEVNQQRLTLCHAPQNDNWDSEECIHYIRVSADDE